MEAAMTIIADDLFRLHDPEEYKLHLATYDGHEEPLDVFVKARDDWIGWNSRRRKRDDFRRKYIFSLTRFYPQPEKWLYGGTFEVVGRAPNSYTLKVMVEHEKFTGRLLLAYKVPTTKGRAFLLENHYPGLIVAQLFEHIYAG
jgi:hypothetical protein